MHMQKTIGKTNIKSAKKMQREKHQKIMKNDTHRSHAKCEFPKILERCIGRFARHNNNNNKAAAYSEHP